ncbi:MAG: type VI secretion system tube protein Hcp [Xanthomonadales bacterium]|nr:type VI secretion system tube protein Hcp [Xanthomonadales bacterium]
MSHAPYFSAPKIVFLTVTLMLALLFAGQALAAVDTFLKIEGVKGESMDKDHKGWIIIESMSSPNMPLAAGSSGTAQKRQHKPFIITKSIDATSPMLKKAANDGTHFPSATLNVADPKNPGQTQQYELENVLISSYQVSGSGADGGIPTETFSLNFEKITFSTRPASKTTLTQKRSE